MVPPSLLDTAVRTLIRYRAWLGDVGWTPVELLSDVFAACDAAELESIETGTLAGSGRLLSPWVWPHWHKLYVARFGNPEPGLPLPALPPAADAAAGPAGVPPADYRILYWRSLEQLEAKRVESGKRLRALREQEELKRAKRHAVVVDARPTLMRKRSREPAASTAKASLLRKLGLRRGGPTTARTDTSTKQPGSTIIIRPSQQLQQRQLPQQQLRQPRETGRCLPTTHWRPAPRAVQGRQAPVAANALQECDVFVDVFGDMNDQQQVGRPPQQHAAAPPATPNSQTAPSEREPGHQQRTAPHHLARQQQRAAALQECDVFDSL